MAYAGFSMFTKIVAGLIAIAILLGVASCIKDDLAEKEAEVHRLESIRRAEDGLFAEISSAQRETSASMDWVRILGLTEKTRIVKIYTKDVQAAFLREAQTLIFGGIIDITEKNPDSYELVIGFDEVEQESRKHFDKEIVFISSCPKVAVDSIESRNTDIYGKSRRRKTRVALIGEFFDISTQAISSKEGDLRDQIRIEGSCDALFLAPQTRGALRSQYFPKDP